MPQLEQNNQFGKERIMTQVKGKKPRLNKLDRAERTERILKLWFKDRLTQPEIAAKVGCAQSTISYTVKGVTPPSSRSEQ